MNPEEFVMGADTTEDLRKFREFAANNRGIESYDVWNSTNYERYRARYVKEYRECYNKFYHNEVSP